MFFSLMCGLPKLGQIQGEIKMIFGQEMQEHSILFSSSHSFSQDPREK